MMWFASVALAAPWDDWPALPIAHPADALACAVKERRLEVACGKGEGCSLELSVTLDGPCPGGFVVARGPSEPRVETPAGFVPWRRCDAGWCWTDLPETGTVRMRHWGPSLRVDKEDRLPDPLPRRAHAVVVHLEPELWTPLPDLTVDAGHGYLVAFSPDPRGGVAIHRKSGPTDHADGAAVVWPSGSVPGPTSAPPSDFVTWDVPVLGRRQPDRVELAPACREVPPKPAEADVRRGLPARTSHVWSAAGGRGPSGVVVSWTPRTAPVYVGVFGPDGHLVEFVGPGDVEDRGTGEARFLSPRALGPFHLCVYSREAVDYRARFFAE